MENHFFSKLHSAIVTGRSMVYDKTANALAYAWKVMKLLCNTAINVLCALPFVAAIVLSFVFVFLENDWNKGGDVI